MDFQFFFIFLSLKSHFFKEKFFKNFPQFAPRGEVFCDHHYFQLFSACKSGLKFQTFKLQLLITFDLIAVDNLRGQLWNQNITGIKEKSNDLFDHNPHIHPTGQGFRGVKKGQASPVFLSVKFWFLNHILG